MCRSGPQYYFEQHIIIVNNAIHSLSLADGPNAHLLSLLLQNAANTREERRDYMRIYIVLNNNMRQQRME